MAVLTYGSNVVLEWHNGEADKVALYAIRKINTGDTIDLAPDYLSVLQVALLGVTTQILEAPTIAGTVLTMPAGLVNVAGYILVWGESS